MTAVQKARKLPEPLDIRCTRSDCDSGLHCFRRTRKMAANQIGRCRSCGVDLINWERVQRKDLADAEFTFESLKREWIRHHFWHAELDEGAQLHARRKGRLRMREAAAKRLRQSIGPTEPVRDGYQTPYEGNALFYAQHALACCCRKCLEYWHGIPRGVELSDDQVTYLVELMMRFLHERMPYLTEAGEKIPPRRHKVEVAD